MMPTLRAEFKKLFTVRSTYVVSLTVLLFVGGLISFYGQGYKTDPSELNSLFLAGTVQVVSSVIAIAAAVVALLLLAHEYRYGTIVYTLVNSNSRSKVLAAKIITVLVFVFGLSLIVTSVSLGLIVAGVAAAGRTLPHQDINVFVYLIKSIFLCEGYALVGLLLAALVRNLVGALVILLIVPNTVEGLLSLLLKHNSVYMPFTALSQVVRPPVLAVAANTKNPLGDTGYLSPTKGALVFLVYLVAGWIITWYLFLRRDATT
jgi:ABC-type transport system involved in multi-copper enzyme maturation permease subunit